MERRAWGLSKPGGGKTAKKARVGANREMGGGKTPNARAWVTACARSRHRACGVEGGRVAKRWGYTELDRGLWTKPGVARQLVLLGTEWESGVLKECGEEYKGVEEVADHSSINSLVAFLVRTFPDVGEQQADIASTVVKHGARASKRSTTQMKKEEEG
ncbi:hypothetical protein GALMADRAFT_245883 [Galerina marginata CBS 339.88]|uniref:Uncharacterized protein n=1 Tax=Galerina marginata (strain CBS 339.88) TaxID=685588 RepID=A0A067T3R1_GALM3|nr:hypothetical protein GALMADRAFT_245883 [Galerina marginata CBS 339.88]